MDFVVNENVILTRLRSSDSNAIALHINDEEIHKNTLSIPFPYQKSDAAKFLARAFQFEADNGIQREWAIRYQGGLIGCIGLLYNHGIYAHKSEIGYWLSKTFRGKGLMTEVIKVFTNACHKDLGLARLEANVFTHNPASSKILIKNNWKYEGLQEKSYIKNGKYLDSHFYAHVKI